MEKCHRNLENASGCFWTILHESIMSFLSGIRDSRKAGSLWGMMRSVGGVRKSIHQSWLAKGLGLGLGLLCWAFRGIQEKIPSEEVSTLQIGSVAFPQGQCTSPQLDSCHRLFNQDGHQERVPHPIVQTLLPVTFTYSLSSEAVVMRQLRRWKRLWRRSLTRSHKRTSMGPCRSCWKGTTNVLQPEVLFTNPSARAGYDTRSIFKQSLTGLNSEFSFS